MPQSKWSADDVRIRFDALKHYAQLNNMDVCHGVGRTPIYMTRMMRGETTITLNTERMIRSFLKDEARRVSKLVPEHPAEAPVLKASSEYLRELSQ